jgi:hypothetical protein
MQNVRVHIADVLPVISVCKRVVIWYYKAYVSEQR